MNCLKSMKMGNSLIRIPLIIRFLNTSQTLRYILVLPLCCCFAEDVIILENGTGVKAVVNRGFVKNSNPRCLFYATWEDDITKLSQKIVDRESWLVGFAEKNDLMLVTWPTDYIATKEPEGVVAGLRNFSTNLRSLLTERLKIKFDQAPYHLIYGASQGSAYAQALAGTNTFLAAASHIGSDYPGIGQHQPIWLITSGYSDYNYDNCVRLYNHFNLMPGPPPIFKAGADLGHRLRVDMDSLTASFFAYCIDTELEVRKQSDKTDCYKEIMALHSLRCQNAPFFGDLKTNAITERRGDKETSIPLPSKSLMEAWKCWPREKILRHYAQSGVFLNPSGPGQ